jgi:hypothetical protein
LERSGAGFSLRGLVLASSKTRRLKPAPLNLAATSSEISRQWSIFCACYFFWVVPEFWNPFQRIRHFQPARSAFAF